MQEGAVELARFCHEVWPLAHSARAAELRNVGTDDIARVSARAGQCVGDHRAGGAFSVRAGHRDALGFAHQAAEHFGVADRLDPRLLCRHAFGVCFSDGGREYDEVDVAGDIFARLPHHDGRAEGRDRVEVFRGRAVRAAHDSTPLQQHHRQRPHTRARDPNQMHMSASIQTAHSFNIHIQKAPKAPQNERPYLLYRPIPPSP